ncbi:rhomboid family intramembrane serine protease [Halobacteriales archaeon SW_7_68_16]|nr:MAG: rhomboid family intramembrane serine protease [Halobacteriales archaeon SW_7_68_16]
MVFPGVTIGIGIVTVVFSLGPVIGFSGVVFAFLGFALVTAPLGAIVALLAANGLGLVYRALREPIVVATASPSPPSPPWWSQIAIQGHALGLLLGVVVGLFVVRNREWTPSATRIWVAVVFAAVAQNLWAVYWFGGGETFVLYRSLGLVLVVVLGALVTAAATASDREIAADISRRDVAVAILLVGLTLLAGPAVPSKAVTVGDDPVPNDRGLTVRDYTVTYDEDVPNRLLSVAERFGIETDDIRTSGVIVTSQRRAIWRSQVSQDRLAFSGTASIGLGGLGWRETVVAQRRGWSAAGNGTAYAVSLRRAGDEFRRVFASDPVRAEPRIDDRTVSVRPPTPNGSMGFRLAVERSNETLGVVAIPGASETATAGGLRLEGRRRGDGIAVYASRNGTVVRVVSEETYR